MATRSPEATAEVSDAADFPPSSVGWRAVGALTILYWFGTLDRQVAALLVPPIKADLHLTDMQVSLLQGLAFGLFFTIASLPVGWLVDRVSRRMVLFCGVIAWSIAATASGLSRTFPQLFAARAGVGAGEATINPTAYSMLSDLFPPGRLSLPLSIFALGGNLGSGMSFVLGGAVVAWIGSRPAFELPLLGQLAGWQVAFIITALPGFFLAFLIWTIPEPKRHRHVRITTHHSTYGDLWRQYARHPLFYIAHNLGFAMMMCFVVGIQSWNAAFLSRQHGWELADIGYRLGVGQITAALLGLAFHGWAVDRLFRSGRTDAHLRYFILMCLLALPCSVAAYLVDDGWLMLLLYNLAYFFVMSFAAIGPAALQITTPSALRGKASSFYMIGISLFGTILGPTAVASLTDLAYKDEALLGYSLATFSALATSFAALLFYIGLKPMRRAVEDVTASSQ